MRQTKEWEIETEDEAMEEESKTDDPVFEMEAANEETMTDEVELEESSD